MLSSLTIEVYVILLVLNTLLYGAMLASSLWAVWKNHLQRRVRILMIAASAFTCGATLDSVYRAWGRIQLRIQGLEPTGPFQSWGAFFGLVAHSLGLIVLTCALNRLAVYSVRSGEEVTK